MGKRRGRLDPSEVKQAMKESADAKAGSAPFHSPFAAARDQLTALVPPKSSRRGRAEKPREEPSILAQTRARHRAERQALGAAVVPARRSAGLGSPPDDLDEQDDDFPDAERRTRSAATVPASTDDVSLFADEMAGVSRLSPDPRGRVRAPPPTTGPAPSRRALDEAEAYATLADLVDGHGPFTVSENEEHLEFLAPGLDYRLLRKLRKGDYALQGHIDLHGCTALEAYRLVEDFLDESRRGGKRCVLIVHGRGLHSKDEIPVLKERVKKWLERGRIARSVLAFASARPNDGGTGALYVLLRR